MIYQIVNNVDASESNGNVEIKDSYKIITPLVQYGYSIYLNYFNNDTKDYIDGTSFGVQFEWMLHNITYVGFKILGDYENGNQYLTKRAIFLEDIYKERNYVNESK